MGSSDDRPLMRGGLPATFNDRALTMVLRVPVERMAFVGLDGDNKRRHMRSLQVSS